MIVCIFAKISLCCIHKMNTVNVDIVNVYLVNVNMVNVNIVNVNMVNVNFLLKHRSETAYFLFSVVARQDLCCGKTRCVLWQDKISVVARQDLSCAKT